MLDQGYIRIMNKFRRLAAFVACLLALGSTAVHAETAVVVYKQSGCDYFIANGPQGLYVLEWYGGYDPDRGDLVAGDIYSYGMKEVRYPQHEAKGTVWVEDYGLSRDSAVEKWQDHCR